jgi:hypothetical protein
MRPQQPRKVSASASGRASTPKCHGTTPKAACVPLISHLQAYDYDALEPHIDEATMVRVLQARQDPDSSPKIR